MGGKGGGSEYGAESGRGGGSGAVSVSLKESDSCKRRIFIELESLLGKREDCPNKWGIFLLEILEMTSTVCCFNREPGTEPAKGGIEEPIIADEGTGRERTVLGGCAASPPLALAEPPSGGRLTCRWPDRRSCDP